jgi:virginiamycin A acetyltransferase
MTLLNFAHNAKEKDSSYVSNESKTIIAIGAMTYTGNIIIYDFSSTRTDGSAPGFILIKRYTSIADQVTIQLFGDHDYKKITMNPLMPLVGDYKKMGEPDPRSESVIIGNDVWIGNNVKILSNIEIGDGAVIGANAVVSKDIPPYAIAVGNPIKVIKYRFGKDIIEEMLKIKWWDWENKKVLENANILRGDDIENFIAIHKI